MREPDAQASSLKHKPRFVASEGVATDQEFLRANCTVEGADGLISEGSECFHDLSVHAVNVQAAAFMAGAQYMALRDAHRRLFAAAWDGVRRSELAAQLELALAMYVDQYHAMLFQKMRSDVEDELLIFMQSVFKDANSQRSRAYWTKRVGALPRASDQEQLIGAWRRCVAPSRAAADNMTFSLVSV